MSFVYRYTDLLRWGTGKNSRLSAADGDNNTWETQTRLVALEDRPLPQPAIDSFTVAGQSLYVNFADSTTLGPYTLPVAKYRSPGNGVWAPLTHYSVLDTFAINGGFYVVNVDHTSAASFDAGANDGAGHDYYTLMFQAPGAALPSGGAPGQILYRTSAGIDYAVSWRWIFPSGTASQYLRRKSAGDDNVEFADIQADEVEFTPPTDSPISAGTVQDAIDQIATGGAMHAEHVIYTPDTGSGLTSTDVEGALNELGARGGGGGKQTMWIPAAAMAPNVTNGADTGEMETPTYKNTYRTLDYDPSTFQGAQFEVAMPKSWDKGDISFKVYWSHDTAATNFGVVWQIYAETLGPNVPLDSSNSDHINVAVTGSATANIMLMSDESDPLTVEDASTFSAPITQSLLVVHVCRSPLDGSDTLAVDARLHGIQLFYTTNASTDA